MRIGEHTVELHGDRIEISDASGQLAAGRWSGGTIVERRGSLSDREWQAVEIGVRLEAEAFISASMKRAYDGRGVDVTQIDRMLSLSPAERLAALDSQRRSLRRLAGK